MNKMQKLLFTVILYFCIINTFIFCEDTTFCYFTRKNFDNCTKIKFDQTNRLDILKFMHLILAYFKLINLSSKNAIDTTKESAFIVHGFDSNPFKQNFLDVKNGLLKLVLEFLLVEIFLIY